MKKLKWLLVTDFGRYALGAILLLWGKIKWLIVTNLGRYALGAMLLLTGVFSQYGTIPFITTDCIFFEYTLWAGVVIMTGQFIFHISAGLYYWAKTKWKF